MKKQAISSWGWVLTVLFIVVVVGNLANIQKGEVEVKEEKPQEIQEAPKQPIIVRMPDLGQDFNNPAEGSLMVMMQLDMDKLKQDLNLDPDYLIFFSSNKINGLHIVYNAKDSTLEGGLPIMKSVNINLAKDKVHQMVYSYKMGSNQSLFFDGQLIAMTKYLGPGMAMTGMAVAEGENNYISYEDFDTKDVMFFKEQLNEEDVKELYE